MKSITASPDQLARATALGRAGRHEEAAKELREMLAAEPGNFEAWLNLGVALEQGGKFAEAVEAYRRATTLRPGAVDPHKFMANALRRAGMRADAAAIERHAITLAPNDASLLSNLAMTLSSMGHLDEVIACRRKVVELQPKSASAGSALLTALHYHQDSTPGMLLKEARKWAGRCLPPGETRLAELKEGQAAATPSLAPAARKSLKRLKIGYVSGSIFEHPEGRFLRVVLATLDRDGFESFVYSASTKSDSVTAVVKDLAEKWRDISLLDDTKAKALIRRDGIDILVDLTGHFSGGRLGIFAQRAAPVQVAHYGYPGATGLETIDWRITDEISDPPGAESQHSEKLWRMEGYSGCYEPPADARAVGARPHPDKPVTFICPNNPLKVTTQVIATWATILLGVPQARLEILAEGGDGYNSVGGNPHYFHEHFARHGIKASRIKLVSRQCRSRGAYFEWIHSADIALDPFPYNGCQTTCDTLWMGVPVVALGGTANWSRQGAALLEQVGLGECVGKDQDDYVKIAVALAADLQRLAEIRSGLRQRSRESRLFDGVGYVRRLESVYRKIWEGARLSRPR